MQDINFILNKKKIFDSHSNTTDGVIHLFSSKILSEIFPKKMQINSLHARLQFFKRGGRYPTGRLNKLHSYFYPALLVNPSAYKYKSSRTEDKRFV